MATKLNLNVPILKSGKSEASEITSDTIVIDNGSGLIKAGFSNSTATSPDLVFPTVIGKVKALSNTVKGEYIGNEIYKAKNLTLNYRNPIEKGFIQDWTDMESIWKFTFQELKTPDLSEFNVLMSDAPLCPKPHRERMTLVLFENFNVSSAYIGIQPTLSLYSSGRTTGLIFECGDQTTHAVPLFEGAMTPNAIFRSDFGGRELNQYLKDLLTQAGHMQSSPISKDSIKDIKEKACAVALNPSDISNEDPKSYQLPDGREVKLGAERFQVMEGLFNPELMGLETIGIDYMLYNCLMQCNFEFRKELFQNIVISGGTSVAKGFEERINQSLSQFTPSFAKAKVHAPPEREFNTWLGGSILGSLSSFTQIWMQKEDYDESGPSIVHRKCF